MTGAEVTICRPIKPAKPDVLLRAVLAMLETTRERAGKEPPEYTRTRAGACIRLINHALEQGVA